VTRGGLPDALAVTEAIEPNSVELCCTKCVSPLQGGAEFATPSLPLDSGVRAGTIDTKQVWVEQLRRAE